MGTSEGLIDGAMLGLLEGKMEGKIVGTEVGEYEGFCEGKILGFDDGRAVDSEGFVVGIIVVGYD